MFSLEESLLLCFIYLPPGNSLFYRNADTCGIKCLENHLLKPEIARLGANILILGDVNARTADGDDYINEIHVVPALRHYEEYLQDDIITKRASCDTHTNTFGIDLIQFCRTYMVHICNGRYDEDKDIGHYTFTGPNGNSVIDYAICSNKLAHLIDKIKV